MSVHSFIPSAEVNILFCVSAVICIAGIYSLIITWGQTSSLRFFTHWRAEAFKDGTVSFLKTLVLDVLLLRRVWRRSLSRWAGHMTIMWSFLFLGGCILISIAGLILAFLDPEGFGGSFGKLLDNLHLPYDLLGYVIMLVALVMIGRRLVLLEVRKRTRITDHYILLIVFFITLTGMIAEWFSGYSTYFGKSILNWEMALMVLQWHFTIVFLLFIMVLPWTRFRHIITVPLLLLARRGGE